MNSAKHSFFCGIDASHEGDSAQAEVVAYFERVSVDRIKYSCITLLIFQFVALGKRKILIYDHILVSLIAEFFRIYFVGKWSENHPAL